MNKHLSFAMLFAAVSAFCAGAVDIPYQCCTYSVQADCAFIHETAAHATIGFSCYGDNFNATLEGKSVPIFGTIFCVNDTVSANFAPISGNVPPTEYVRYINGYYRKPHEGRPFNPSLPSSYKDIWGAGTLSADAATMECVNLTADMLCLFYYSKTFDFSKLPQGVPQNISVVMPDSSNRILQLTFDGYCDYGGGNAYHLTANFTYDGVMSAYPITVIVDPRLGIPVEFAADIAIGRVVMSYEY